MLKYRDEESVELHSANDNIDVNARDSLHGKTLFRCVAGNAYAGVFMLSLVKETLDVNVKAYHWETPLGESVANGHMRVLKSMDTDRRVVLKLSIVNVGLIWNTHED